MVYEEPRVCECDVPYVMDEAMQRKWTDFLATMADRVKRGEITHISMTIHLAPSGR